MKESIPDMQAMRTSGSRPAGPLPANAGLSFFLPVLLVALAVVASLAFQAVQLVREQRQLSLAMTALEAQQQAAVKLRASLDAVATATAKLAADGNANAGVIVAELAKRGITITPKNESKPK